jgi:hypothetical protein
MRRYLFNPVRLNVCNAAAKQTCGFDQFGRHNPAWFR